MNVTATLRNISGRLTAISSKSDAHRAMIAAAVSDAPTEISLNIFSKDIEATARCLAALGAKIERGDTYCRVEPVLSHAESPLLDCGESGSTLRFLIPLAKVMAENPRLSGAGRLAQRPIAPLLDAMKSRGCSFSAEALPLTMSGTLEAGEYKLPGDISSQFVSGLLFALPLLSSDSEIALTSPLQSSAYVDMTLDTLDRFGIEILKTDRGFSVPGGQKYKSPISYAAEGDWSNSAPFMVMAALCGEVTIDNLNISSKQSDKAIIPILESFGARVLINGNSVTVARQDARPFETDISQFPDLFPVIAVLACGAEGTSTIYNAERLRLKESDRIESTLSLIKAFGGEAHVDGGTVTVCGRGSLSGGACDSFNDHRISMAALCAAAICENPVKVSDFEAINKSYPDFLRDYKCLGGWADVI